MTTTRLHTDVTTDVVVITPDVATQWLAHNACNRKIRPTVVAAYARDMEAGTWHLNGETIKRTSDGALLDGQHRLNAVIRAGIPIPMIVVSGLPAEVRSSVDTGLRRLYADVLTMQNESNPFVLASVARRAVAWHQGKRLHSGGKGGPTHAEQAAYLAEHPEIRRSVKVAQHVRRFIRLYPSTVGLTHHLCDLIETDQADWFFARLADGADLGPGHPLLTFRNRVNDMSEYSRLKLTETDRQGLLIMAWNEWRDGKTSERIILPKGGFNSRNFPSPH